MASLSAVNQWIFEKSNLPQITLHGLRHSAVSNLLDANFSVIQVREDAKTALAKKYRKIEKTPQKQP